MSYETKTVIELRAIAKENGLTGYSKLKKSDLIDLIKDCNEIFAKENNKKGTILVVDEMPRIPNDISTVLDGKIGETVQVVGKEESHFAKMLSHRKEGSLIGTEVFEKMNRHQKRRYLKLSRSR